jgi:hypothetical protein
MKLDEMDIPLERDLFLRSLIRELSGVIFQLLKSFLSQMVLSRRAGFFRVSS